MQNHRRHDIVRDQDFHLLKWLKLESKQSLTIRFRVLDWGTESLQRFRRGCLARSDVLETTGTELGTTHRAARFDPRVSLEAAASCPTVRRQCNRQDS